MEPQVTRSVLITGAVSGIGLHVARILAGRGDRVIITSRSLEMARQAAAVLTAESGNPVLALALELTDQASITALAHQLNGPLDGLIHNAAAHADWSLTPLGVDVDAAEQVMATNLFGTWRLTQALMPVLRRSAHPRIVVVTSAAGSHGDPRFGLPTSPASAPYAVSKAALTAWTVKLAAELGELARVSAVDPDLTATAPGMEQMGARPPAASAAGIVWALDLPDDGPTGGFFRDGHPLPW